jgi:NitT/TauT family transport system substrate-binding protein
MLEKLGLRPEDVAKTAIPQMPVRLEMLKSGQVDAATLPEPLASVAVKSGATMLNSSDNLGINPGVLLFTKETIQSKNAEIAAFYRAYNSAVEYLQDAPVSDYVDILIDVAGFPEDVKDSLSLPAYTPAALPSADDFDGVMAWLTEKGLIQNTYQYDDLVDKSFVK